MPALSFSSPLTTSNRIVADRVAVRVAGVGIDRRQLADDGPLLAFSSTDRLLIEMSVGASLTFWTAMAKSSGVAEAALILGGDRHLDAAAVFIVQAGPGCQLQFAR